MNKEKEKKAYEILRADILRFDAEEVMASSDPFMSDGYDDGSWFTDNGGMRS